MEDGAVVVFPRLLQFDAGDLDGAAGGALDLMRTAHDAAKGIQLCHLLRENGADFRFHVSAVEPGLVEHTGLAVATGTEFTLGGHHVVAHPVRSAVGRGDQGVVRRGGRRRGGAAGDHQERKERGDSKHCSSYQTYTVRGTSPGVSHRLTTR